VGREGEGLSSRTKILATALMTMTMTMTMMMTDNSRIQPARLGPGEILPKPQKFVRQRSHCRPPTPDLQSHWRLTTSHVEDNDPAELHWHTSNIQSHYSNSFDKFVLLRFLGFLNVFLFFLNQYQLVCWISMQYNLSYASYVLTLIKQQILYKKKLHAVYLKLYKPKL